MIIEFPFYLKENLKKPKPPTYNWFDISVGFDSSLSFFPAFSSIFFSYGTPTAALPVFKELNNNTSKRIKKVYRNTIIVLFIIYSLIGLSGYFSVPGSTPKLIIDRESIFNTDIPMTIGKILFMFTLIFAFAVNYICLRTAFVEIIYKDPASFDKSNMNNRIMTFLIIVATTSISCSYSKATDYMSMLGGFLAVIIANLIPTFLWLKTTKSYSTYHWKRLTVITLTSICVIMGWTCGIITAIKVFSPKQS